MFELHQEDTVHVRRLESQDGLFSDLRFYLSAESKKFYLYKLERFGDVGKCQFGVGKYQEFFAWCILNDLIECQQVNSNHNLLASSHR